MRKFVKRALPALTAALLVALATCAFAAEITVANGLDVRVSIAFAYYDADSGTFVTKGWWHAEPGAQTVVALDADESRDIFYAAYNKDQFVDSSTRGNPVVKRWTSPRNFTFATDEEPAGEGAWQGRFYKVNGSTLNIDGRPRGN